MELISSDNRAVLVGDATQRFLHELRADVAIFSVQSISDSGECFDCYAEEVAVRKVMLQNARKKILLCDSSKLGKTCFYNMGHVSELDGIISEKPLPDTLQKAMKKCENTR